MSFGHHFDHSVSPLACPKDLLKSYGALSVTRPERPELPRWQPSLSDRQVEELPGRLTQDMLGGKNWEAMSILTPVPVE